MSKREMAAEIVSTIKWNNTSKQNHIKQACKMHKEDVERIYNAYLKDKEHALFYASLL